MFPLLSVTLFLPLLGAGLLLALREVSPRGAHAVGIAFSSLSLLGAAGIWARGVGPGFSQVEEAPWIPAINLAYRVGVDGISFPLVLLTAVLFFVSFVFSAKVTERARTYVTLFLLLETACLGVFMALDAILFSIFFDLTLIAMYFVISRWGHDGAQRAALKFFLYTFLGSLPLLLAILGLYLGSEPNTFDMREFVAAPPLSGLAATLAFAGMFVAFGIKTPLFPVHTWLPAAHVEAPTAGSVILAGVLLKLGTYGFVRFALQMTPDAFRAAAPFVAGLAVFTALYGAFAALGQTDLKRLVAYTSVNHMGYAVLGIAAAAAATEEVARARALDGAVLQMVSHGIVTGALFLLVGIIQDRAHTREMREFGGLLAVVPALGWLFVLAAFASLGLPGLAHFPAEFQIFLGTFRVYPVAGAVVVLGIAITAGLFLRAVQVAFFGKPSERWLKMPDLDRREVLAVAPLVALTVAIGVAPFTLLYLIHRTTEAINP